MNNYRNIKCPNRYLLMKISISNAPIEYVDVITVYPRWICIEMTREQLGYLIINFDLTSEERNFEIVVEDLRISPNLFKLRLNAKLTQVGRNEYGNFDVFLDIADDSLESGKLVANSYLTSIDKI